MPIAELLYADDLVVLAESEEELSKMLNRWKNGVQSKGMKVNMNKTAISGERCKGVHNTGRWPCGVCGRGVGIETQYSVLSVRDGCTGSVVV